MLAQGTAAPPIFDLVLANGVVVNQDGEGRAISASAMAASPRSRARRRLAGQRIDCKGCTFCRASSTARCIFASRASFTRRILRPARAPLCSAATAVRNAQYRSDDDDRRGARRQGRRAKGAHCDFAFWVGGTHDNVADLCRTLRLPGAGIKGVMGSSTGKLLVADDKGHSGDPQSNPTARGVSQRGRDSPQRAESATRFGRSVVASRLA